MSVWEFNAAVAGYIAANTPDGGGGMTPVEEDELWAWMQTKEAYSH